MPAQQNPDFDRALSNLSSLMDRMGDFKEHLEIRLTEIKSGQDRIDLKIEDLRDKLSEEISKSREAGAGLDKRLSITEGRVEDLLSVKNKMIWLIIALVISFAGNVALTAYHFFVKA